MKSMSEFARVGQRLIDAHWIFAKTMPDNPHWYTLRREWLHDDDFIETVQFIRRHGYQEIYGGRPYTMLNVNDYKYWTMGAPLHETILINRKLHNDPSDYDLIAGLYDNAFSDPESLHENRTVMDMLLPVPPGILDVGCGTGLLLDYCQPENYTGIDPSRQMLNLLKRKHPAYAKSVIQTRLEDFVGTRYNLIVALFGSASYIELAALQDIPRRLNPGGRFFLMLFKSTYNPVTYQRTGVSCKHFTHDPADLPGTITEFNNFMIVDGRV